MTIFQHPVSGGQWHCCPHCPQQGDMLQLAAALWKLSLPAAALKAKSLGCEIPDVSSPALTEYQRWYVELPQRLRTLWQEAQQQLGHPDGRRLLQKLHWRFNSGVAWNEEGVRQVLGCLPAERIQELFAGGTPAASGPWPVDGFVKDGRSGRLFKVSKVEGQRKPWGGVLVVPSYDLPGRLVGFHFIGREADDKDRVFCLTDPFSQETGQREMGISCHPRLLETSETVVAFRNDYWYLRLMCRGLELRAEPPNLVCWRQHSQGATRHAWQMFAGRKIVFWDQQLDAALLQQAMRADGHLAISRHNSLSSISDDLANLQPHEAAQRFEEQARPWPQALEKYFRRRPEAELEDFLLQLESLGEDVGRVLQRCPRGFAERAKAVLQRSRPSRSITLDGRTVEERPDGWYIRKGEREECLVNARVRFDRLIWYPRKQRSAYQGRILQGDREIAFSVDRDVVEANPLRWLQDELLKAQAGFVHVSPAWRTKFMAIATRFQEPTLVTGLESVGWDEGRNELVLADYSLTFDGRVEPHPFFPAPARRLTRRDEAHLDVPARLPRPSLPSPSTLAAAMRSSPGTRSFWSLYCTVAANVLAPILGRPMTSVALLGFSAQQVAAAVALATDCQTLPLSELSAAPQNEHNWPTLVLPQSVPGENRLGVLGGYPGLMTETDLPQAATCLWQGGWHLLEPDSAASFDLSRAQELTSLLPSYLQYLLQRRLAPVQTGSLLTNVRQSLGRWIYANYQFQADAVSGLSDRHRDLWEDGGSGHIDLLPKLLYWLFESGRVRLVGEGMRAKGPVVWQGQRIIYVPKQLVRNVLQEARGLPFDPDRLTQLLATAGVLKADGACQDQPCWGVSLEWLQAELHRVRSRKVKMVRLAEGT